MPEALQTRGTQVGLSSDSSHWGRVHCCLGSRPRQVERPALYTRALDGILEKRPAQTIDQAYVATSEAAFVAGLTAILVGYPVLVLAQNSGLVEIGCSTPAFRFLPCSGGM